ncbi:MCP four helix bundle domain-containing protein [Aquincola sp. S2]|uniref:MCP four helix bundle domain-containing protein n=1 Tax=Pseudaquabacterium terrae TaxID=2732868 RepID=A0ABX2EAA9_9BURK|nr:methyl-accepting chemotaxis protein [Aquabacterium terrae]NRF65448.1 MCP four helix bundle domain-containing protein [Aquabacterium terrae]
MKLSNLKVGTRLGAGFAIVLAMTLALASVGIWQMGQMKTAFEYISLNTLPSLDTVADVGRGLETMRRAELRHLVERTPQSKLEQESLFERGLETYNKASERYVKTLLTDERDKTNMAVLAAKFRAYLETHRRLIELSNAAAGDPLQQEAASAYLLGASLRALDEVHDALRVVDRYNYEIAEGAKQTAGQSYSTAWHAMLAAATLAVVVGVALAWAITRSLVRQLGTEPATAAALAQSVADGDLSVSIDLRPGDTTSLMVSLSSMRDSLSRVVSGVRENAEGVATASAQIAQGNNDLSSRTEEQASALEETAASMEQLGSTVRQNADNARQANQLALSASAIATQGGEVVTQVVDTMKGINESSKKIADIIGVIDGIAFQTNILALNAAVEAARAGEQGRGFAVVAGEVRNLAQRSAEAAKEIKSLITASVERVEHGTVLVDQAGMTMTEIVTSIRRVTDIMGEISAANTEQSAGVAQVGEAVSQMDQTTQQNAALVEEGAAAAESLKQQAQQLVQAVAVFKLVQATHADPARNVVRTAVGKARSAVPHAAALATTQPASMSTAARNGTDEWARF